MFTRYERWYAAVNRAPYDLSKKHSVFSPPGGGGHKLFGGGEFNKREVIILGCIYALPPYRDLMRAEDPKHIPTY